MDSGAEQEGVSGREEVLMPLKASFLRGLLVSLLILMASACTDSMPAEFPVPEFSLSSPLTGMVADNSTIEGRPAVLYWFTSW